MQRMDSIRIIKTGMKKMRIGIPNTLFSSYHLAYWYQLITLSGMEAVLSDESTQEMADRGKRLLPHEFCLPIKLFIGHVLNLLDKDVDQILLPRMTSKGRANFFCPKLIGLPEIVRYTTNLEETRMFSPEIRYDGLHLQVTKFPSPCSVALRRMKIAARQANKAWEKLLITCREQHLTLSNLSGKPPGILPVGEPLTIGLLGYAYSLYDPFISKAIPHQLLKLGATIITWEMLDPIQIEENLIGLKRPIFWNFGKMLLGAGLHFLKAPQTDGLIYVSTFGCGPDSVIAKILSIEAGNKGKPFLQINLDEHLEDGHLRTRLEAFVDMLTPLKEDKVI